MPYRLVFESKCARKIVFSNYGNYLYTLPRAEKKNSGFLHIYFLQLPQLAGTAGIFSKMREASLTHRSRPAKLHIISKPKMSLWLQKQVSSKHNLIGLTLFFCAAIVFFYVSKGKNNIKVNLLMKLLLRSYLILFIRQVSSKFEQVALSAIVSALKNSVIF